jgi:hypothetical protein
VDQGHVGIEQFLEGLRIVCPDSPYEFLFSHRMSEKSIQLLW